MMKSAHLGKRRDAPHRSRLDSPRLRSILRQDEMVSGTVIVTGITRNDPANLPLVKSNHVIQALAVQGPQKPLRRPILPRRARGNRNREQIHAPNPLRELGSLWSQQVIDAKNAPMSARTGSYLHLIAG
jgi:hypothetical protein